MANPETILPQSIAAKAHIQAFDLTARDMLADLPVSAVLVHLTEFVPASALDILIAQWGLSGNGVDLSGLTEAGKRALIRQAVLLASRKGTIWAVRYMFDVFGMPEIVVEEADALNADMFYDGVYFYSGVATYGTSWHWAEYAVRIVVDSATVTVGGDLLDIMEGVLAEYAPARCHLVMWTIQGNFTEPLSVADVLQITVTP